MICLQLEDTWKKDPVSQILTPYQEFTIFQLAIKVSRSYSQIHTHELLTCVLPDADLLLKYMSSLDGNVPED